MELGPCKRLIRKNIREIDEVIELSEVSRDYDLLRAQIKKTTGAFKLHYEDIDKSLDGWADYNPDQYKAYLEKVGVLKSLLEGIKNSPPSNDGQNSLAVVDVNVTQSRASANSYTNVSQSSVNTNENTINLSI